MTKVAGRAVRWRPVAIVAAVAGSAFAGWTWPVVAPVVAALVALPVVYCVLTPTRHVIRALDASARTFVTSAAASAGVVAMFVEWPLVVKVASSLATVVHGVVLPAASPAWDGVRRRLRLSVANRR